MHPLLTFSALPVELFDASNIELNNDCSLRVGVGDGGPMVHSLTTQFAI